ncbi:DUF1295 domain-containing protein [Nocardia altamirensis]|uniref:DUF1295 domain-containing protein n=1 Tax=Nocardia altamirensis TaxID=472158 RepID=UPI000840096E|nr:DUF1295 domain-containing protein [Nocardia altamirensis]
MKQRITTYVLFAAGWILLLTAAPTAHFAAWNLLIQLAIFIPVVAIPAWRTGRMSSVDIAWPLGLAAIGLQTFIFAESLTPLTITVGACYTVIGARMGIWGIHMWRRGEFDHELPRYVYQRRRWERAGFRSERVSLQFELSVQALANATFLAMPAILISTNHSTRLTAVECLAILVWLIAYGLESLSDLQKSRFAAAAIASGNRTSICDVGLWRYSRHPNYFFQWTQWVALAILAVPSAVALHDRVSVAQVALLIFGLGLAVYLMYNTLVVYTGAVPAEYYSVRKRPAYAEYQKTVNRFVPGRRRSI